MGAGMELRHLRYFVAVAEAGSLTVAAQNLHTSQPSLSRQIRDLEDEIGVQPLGRSARRIELTAGGRAFLDHARAVLTQAEAGAEAARRVAHPAKPCFAMGFLTGHELTWMPEALQILRDELPNIDVMISSQYSPLLADGLSKGKIAGSFSDVWPTLSPPLAAIPFSRSSLLALRKTGSVTSLSRILTTQEIGSSSSMCNEYKTRGSAVAALRWWKAPLKKLSCGCAALGHLQRRLPKFKKWASSPHPKNCAAAAQ